MNGLALFAGVGGLELGLRIAIPGYRTAAYCEIDEYAQKVLSARMQDGCLDVAPVFDDVRLIHSRTYLDKHVRIMYPPLDGNSYSKEEEVMAGKLKKLTEDNLRESIRMYEKGLSVAQIAVYFGVTRQALWDVMRRRGVKFRPQLRFDKDNHFYRGGKKADDHAHNMVEYAVRVGSVERKTVCQECGNMGQFKDGRSKIQAHHPDYNKPLDVIWLCQKCHHAWHEKFKPKGKEVMQEVPDVDIISGGFP